MVFVVDVRGSASSCINILPGFFNFFNKSCVDLWVERKDNAHSFKPISSYNHNLYRVTGDKVYKIQGVIIHLKWNKKVLFDHGQIFKYKIEISFFFFENTRFFSPWTGHNSKIINPIANLKAPLKSSSNLLEENTK